MPTLYSHLQTGVYRIHNNISGKNYVGGAYKSFKQRKELHWRSLRKGKHFNVHLQSAWNKYGEQTFEFVIIERYPVEECESRETHWIAHYEATNQDFGYNRQSVAKSSVGTTWKWSDEAKAAWSKKMKKDVVATERIRTAAKAKRGRDSEETTKKRSKARRGKKASERAKESMRAAWALRKQRKQNGDSSSI